MISVILAAGRGSRLKEKTDDQPKCLVALHGKALLDWQLKALREAGINEITIVTGYKGERLCDRQTDILTNSNWANSNMVSSLYVASDLLTHSVTIVSYSDIVYPAELVISLAKETADIAITYDVNWEDLWRQRFDDPLDDAETFRLDSDGFLSEIGQPPTSTDDIQGQYMGLLRFTPKGWKEVKSFLDSHSPDEVAQLDMTTLLQRLIESGIKIKGAPYHGKWYEVDTPKDYALYSSFPALF